MRAATLASVLLALVASPPAAEALPVGDLWISEVMYNPSGGDNGYEWVELFNAGSTEINLSNYSLGWGGDDYTTGLLQLSGNLSPGDYFVVGGPNSGATNGNPIYDQAQDFNPNLENGSIFTADGIALFDELAVDATAATVPIHVIIYGGLLNLNDLMDENGLPGAVDFFFGGAGSSLEFDGAGWAAQASSTPGSGTLIPEPAPALLIMLGLAGLALKGAPRHRKTR